MLPRSSGSRPPPGRVAARRCSSRARVSGRSWLRSGSGVVSRSRSWQRPARLAFTARPRRRRPLLGEHAAGGADRVERVGLAARAALPPQPADLEHLLTAHGQETRQTGTERTGAFDRERAPTRGVLVDEPEDIAVPLVTRGDVRLEHDRAADDVHDRERVPVAVRIDTNHVVQLICEHPLTDLQPKRWGTHPVSVWGGKPRAAEL